MMMIYKAKIINFKMQKLQIIEIQVLSGYIFYESYDFNFLKWDSANAVPYITNFAFEFPNFQKSQASARLSAMTKPQS